MQLFEQRARGMLLPHRAALVWEELREVLHLLSVFGLTWPVPTALPLGSGLKCRRKSPEPGGGQRGIPDLGRTRAGRSVGEFRPGVQLRQTWEAGVPAPLSEL